MSERKCKRCGNIDTGIWNTVALIGWSLMVGGLGYSLADIFHFEPLSVIALMFGLILMLPIFFISYHEREIE